ncbi:MAG: protein translocase subunit SecD [Bacteroidales bacterium]|nr:protein translocase subunit SecD [Bacteroidales bacterium]
MRNKGLVLFFTILIALTCLYCLSFTVVTKSIEKDAQEYAQGPEAQAAIKEAVNIAKANGKIDKSKEDAITYDVTNSFEREYLDKMKDSSVFLGFTYGECKYKELNLGLDLQGGMSVTLALSSPQLIQQLCSNSEDPLFIKTFEATQKKYANGATGEDFIDLFAKEFENQKKAGNSNAKLATFFGNNLNKKSASDDDVIKALKDKRTETMDQTFKILRTRIDRFGVAQPNLQTDQSGRIIVELPGVKDKQRVEDLLKSTAQLEFWRVYTEYAGSGQGMVNQFPANFKAAVNKAAANATDSLEKKRLEKVASLGQNKDNLAVAYYSLQDTAIVGECLPAIIEALNMQDNLVLYWGKADKKTKLLPLVPLIKAKDDCGPVLCSKTVDKGERIIRSAEQNVDEYNRVIVNMTMEDQAAEQWQSITKSAIDGNVPVNIAIVLDQMVYSYPHIQSEIANGRSQISGNFDVQEAKELAIVLNSGGLDVGLDIIASDLVGPTLGEKSIKSGFLSFALAFLLVLIYMFLYYSRAGLVADIALVSNVFILIGVLASLGAVLTLPGIAGVVLTMGMAVDANVLIYERIREEVRNGKGMRLAVSEGYKNAYSAIIDGNVTTLITGIVLYIVGSGPVQGFAITLIIGIISSLFTAIFISRMIFETKLQRGKELKFGTKKTLNAFSNVHFNFLGTKKMFYIISCSLIVIMIGSFFINKLQMGIDFAGGRTYVVLFDQPVDASKASEAVTKEFGGAPQVKNFGNNNQLRVTINYKVDDPSESVEQDCKKKLYKSLNGLYANHIDEATFNSVESGEYGIQSAQRVQAAMASELIWKAFLSVFISLILIFIYIAIRFRNWQFGLGSILTLAHDTIITIGLFSLFWRISPFSMEVDQQFIAAILTVIGYSINNVVIIYDRVRENLTLSPKNDLFLNFNNAINSTLGRNVNTCGTTIIVLLVIFIFGGEVIRGFVFAMLTGILCGTYSGIFIAPGLAFDLLNRSKKKANVAKIKLMK